MVRGQRIIPGDTLRPVRIEPRMEFHSTLMRFNCREIERIECGNRGFPLLTRQPIRPGLDQGRIESVALRPDLKNDSIDADALESI
jgi:hypothetical protein